ncbi:MAG: PDZ domain-containing protein [Actinobacteria bacterium]|nr:PDZ domain-containing protein [Actinomycetota bacterium]
MNDTHPTSSPAPVRSLPTSRLWWFTGPVLLLLLAGVLTVAVRPVPYLALIPGSARSVEPLVTVTPKDGGPVPDEEAPDDGLLFVTVSVRRPSGIEALWRLTNDTDQVVPEKTITGGQSREENTRFNLQLMTDSKDKATKVALERAGYEVEVRPSGAVVVDLDPTYPVAEAVRPGDTIVGADGEVVRTSTDLKDAIAAHRPGDEIELRIEPFGPSEPRTARVELRENPDKPGAAQLGVSLDDRPDYTFPIEVEIDSGQVGGPSAGLAFTLAILDRITPGDLTGPDPVAVTGTIELDGSVGPVGGVLQKTEAAVRAGAKLFIVPTQEYEDAVRAARGRLEVRQVTTLDEALAVLEDHGGDPLPATEPPTG